MPITTPTPEELVKAFPAKYTDTILDAIGEELFDRSLIDGVICDPFAGIGGIHTFADRYPNLTTVGIDIEPEQAALHPRTVCGDSRRISTFLPKVRDVISDAQGAPCHQLPISLFDAIVTSPAYGNRLADQYLGSDDEKCRACKGIGRTDKGSDCSKCVGTGKARSKRMGYSIALGRTLTQGSGAALQWGTEYREMHSAVIAEVATLLKPGGWWIVNVSSSLGAKGYKPVMEWWVECIAEHARIVKLRSVETPRIRFGQNHDRRVPVEHLIVAKADA